MKMAGTLVSNSKGKINLLISDSLISNKKYVNCEYQKTMEIKIKKHM